MKTKHAKTAFGVLIFSTIIFASSCQKEDIATPVYPNSDTLASKDSSKIETPTYLTNTHHI